MDRLPVNSRAASTAGWEKDTLEVEYPNGEIWQYPAVDNRTYESLLTAPSFGSYLAMIRRSHAGIKV